jgi:dTDP-4-dehydrorhamnose reductase
MRILITGYKGQLGVDLVKEIQSKHPKDTIIGLDIDECNLIDGPAVIAFTNASKPDAIVHLAAYTAVDKAESNALACFDVNALGTANIVSAAVGVDAKLLYISSDYVFDGTKNGAYIPNDTKNPLSVYGMSKAIGEDAVLKWHKHFIIRTSWVFGKSGKNFIYTMLNLAATGAVVNVVNDQVGSPTYTKHLSVLIDEMIHSEKYGIYHGTNENFVSWFQFAKMIFEKGGYNPDKLNPIPSSSYNTAAKRPLNSRLSKDCLTEAGFNHLPTVEEALEEFMEETGTLKEMK